MDHAILYAVLSLAEAIAVVVLWNFTPVKVSVQTPLNRRVGTFGGSLLVHTHRPVCKLGMIVSWLLAALILCRLVVLRSWGRAVHRLVRIASWVVVGLVLIGSALLNMNAFVLFVPVVIFEVVLDRLLRLL
jgi:hypothetical protein